MLGFGSHSVCTAIVFFSNWIWDASIAYTMDGRTGLWFACHTQITLIFLYALCHHNLARPLNERWHCSQLNSPEINIKKCDTVVPASSIFIELFRAHRVTHSRPFVSIRFVGLSVCVVCVVEGQRDSQTFLRNAERQTFAHNFNWVTRTLKSKGNFVREKAYRHLSLAPTSNQRTTTDKVFKAICYFMSARWFRFSWSPFTAVFIDENVDLFLNLNYVICVHERTVLTQ